jgi:hypothetical protein
MGGRNKLGDTSFKGEEVSSYKSTPHVTKKKRRFIAQE